ncbi:MAG: helix-turn-helix domain-containing protein [Planctomycetia bacterium]|nr:helix-turn-helix domain-containing protein [Planctomycetia bacterium]
MKTFADRLTAAIEATRETHKELARETDLPLALVVEFCNGTSEPSPIRAHRIADVLGCNHNWLLNGFVSEGRDSTLVRELELASLNAANGVVTLDRDDFRRIYTLACMSIR